MSNYRLPSTVVIAPAPATLPSATVPVAALQPISRRHLDVLTDELGILQHAIRSRPNRVDGYAVDEIARALQVDVLHAQTLGWPAVHDSAWRNLRFLQGALDVTTGMFRSFRAVSGAWLDGRPSQDSHGRTMLALGETIAGAPDDELRTAAIDLWTQGLPGAGRLTEPRAQAAVVLGCDAMLRISPDEAARALLARFARGLDRRFRASASSDWFWPENELTGENGLLPRCLIVAGLRLGSTDMVGTGVQAIDWLLRVQISASGHLSPIGDTGWTRGGVRSRFDQQPIEATAILLAAEAALEATGEPRFGAAMELAYGWFLGRNDLGLSVAHPARGAGSDGLMPGGVHPDEGAESSLMWLMAAEHIRAHRARPPVAIAAPAAGRERGRIGDARYVPPQLVTTAR